MPRGYLHMDNSAVHWKVLCLIEHIWLEQLRLRDNNLCYKASAIIPFCFALLFALWLMEWTTLMDVMDYIGWCSGLHWLMWWTTLADAVDYTDWCDELHWLMQWTTLLMWWTTLADAVDYTDWYDGLHWLMQWTTLIDMMDYIGWCTTRPRGMQCLAIPTVDELFGEGSSSVSSSFHCFANLIRRCQRPARPCKPWNRPSVNVIFCLLNFYIDVAIRILPSTSDIFYSTKFIRKSLFLIHFHQKSFYLSHREWKNLSTTSYERSGSQ